MLNVKTVMENVQWVFFQTVYLEKSKWILFYFRDFSKKVSARFDFSGKLVKTLMIFIVSKVVAHHFLEQSFYD